jgi:Ohr subfamily peroxiredoxin
MNASSQAPVQVVINPVVYRAEVSTSGGRDGRAVSSDERLQVNLSTPKALGGNDGPGTNPEQLFAAGYSACFIGAMKFVAGQQKKALPADTRVDAVVGIGPVDTARSQEGRIGFGIDAELSVHLPGFSQEEADALVAMAHRVCPYSNATRGNIDVRLKVTV